MLTRQISIAAPIFLLIYAIQESVISQFRLPGGGFSILLIFALTWAVLSETEVQGEEEPVEGEEEAA